VAEIRSFQAKNKDGAFKQALKPSAGGALAVTGVIFGVIALSAAIGAAIG
jgi:hypothetical protein